MKEWINISLHLLLAKKLRSTNYCFGFLRFLSVTEASVLKCLIYTIVPKFLLLIIKFLRENYVAFLK